ncbi:MAG: hypothetical protein GX640_09540 [Fibrobacter sp.]|nr:hypothetical protein [Fibrobacter sp.]
MEVQPKPFVWQMIREAVEVHGNKCSNADIKEWIVEHYPGTSVNSILNHIIICTVNHESRVHYKENNRPRRCTDILDFLYRPCAGKVEMYDSRIHGNWEIAQDEKGVLFVRQIKEIKDFTKDRTSVTGSYIETANLRAYLAKNLELIENNLELYVDGAGNDGVEYPTDFGPIDLLCIDRNGAFIITEILTSNTPDASTGQILKHRTWVRRHLAFGKPLRCYLVGSSIPEHVRYSLADNEDVFLKEYDLTIRLKDIPKISDLQSAETVQSL